MVLTPVDSEYMYELTCIKGRDEDMKDKSNEDFIIKFF